MAPRMGVGTFSARTTAGSQTVSGLGFQPNALLMWSTHATASGFSDGLSMAIGVATSSSQQAVVSMVSQDNSTNTNTACGHLTTRIANQLSDTSLSPASVAVASFSAFTSDGFTLSWSTAPSVATIHNYAALAVESAKVGQISAPTSNGTLVVRGVGFQPECIILISTGLNTTTNATTASMSFGAATSYSRQWGMSSWEFDNGVGGAFKSSGAHVFAAQYTASTTSAIRTADLMSLDPDGFTLSFAGTATTAANITYLALRGGQFYVGNTNQGSSSTQSLAAPFIPTGLVAFGVNSTATGFESGGIKMSMGAANAKTSAATWVESYSAANPADSRRWTGTDAVIIEASKPSTVNAKASMSGFDGAGALLSWDTQDAVARKIGFIAVGGNTVVKDDDFFRCGATGNSRHLIGGYANKSGSVRWRVNEGTWNTISITAQNTYESWIEYPFVEGSLYRVEVQAIAGGLIDVLFDDYILWHAGIYDCYAGWLDRVPEWIKDSQMAQAIWATYAQQQNDLYAMIDDFHAQTEPTRATWALPLWEELVGIRRVATNATLAQRRTAVMGRRVPKDGTRVDFFASIYAFLGMNPLVTETLPSQRADVRLPTNSPQLRASMDELLAIIKPVGLELVATSGSFLAGTSKAGDPL